MCQLSAILKEVHPLHSAEIKWTMLEGISPTATCSYNPVPTPHFCRRWRVERWQGMCLGRGIARILTARIWQVEDLFRGLMAMHQRGIIHRDIRPANVLVRLHVVKNAH
jgi:serine/threonine protein kinase